MSHFETMNTIVNQFFDNLPKSYVAYCDYIAHTIVGNLKANDNVSLSIETGSIHALVGENGAGKSTLSNILYGLLQPDSGAIEIDGKAVKFSSARQAIEAGIGMVHQHFMLVDTLSALDNVMLGAEPAFFLSRAKKRDINCDTPVAIMLGLLEAIIDREADLIERLQTETELLVGEGEVDGHGCAPVRSGEGLGSVATPERPEIGCPCTAARTRAHARVP